MTTPADLPVNVDTTYPDTGAADVKAHQQHHDTVHAFVQAQSKVAVVPRPKSSLGTNYFGVPDIILQGQGDHALTAEQVYYEPMIVRAAIRLDSLAVRVNVAGTAGGVCHAGVYNADADWQPLTLVVGSTALAIDSAGMKEASGLATTLPAGLYLRALKLSVAATMSYFTGGGFGVLTTDLRSGMYLPRGTGAAGALPATGVRWDAVSSGAGTPFRNNVVMAWSQL